MSKKEIPKYVKYMLQRRLKCAAKLAVACWELQDYCESIGVDILDPNNALLSDIRICTEPPLAYKLTEDAIKKALGIEENQS